MVPSARWLKRSLLLLFPIFFAATFACQAQTNVLAWHNDLARTGQNLTEPILTPELVNSANFGLLENIPVDGKVDAQPLYVSALIVPGVSGRHNVLFIATEHDTVYAVDADTAAIYWKKTMLGTGETTSDDHNCSQVAPEIGITATPAIDLTAGPHGTLFVVAMSKTSSSSYIQRIHALDVTTGAEQFNGPVAVQATYPGTGDGSSNGTVTFAPGQYKERPALLVQNGTLYTSWGSHCDYRPYSGWMMAYNETTLAQTSVISFAPNGYEAAPWNSGAGPAADTAGNIYISLGNGLFDTALTTAGFPSKEDYGNSLVRLALQSGKLNVLDYWTMYNSDTESNSDTDLGSGGLMLLPNFTDAKGTGRYLSVAAGKDGNLYVADRTHMGHYDATNDATIYQQLTGALPGGVWGSPAYFNSHVYYGSVNSNLRSFSIVDAELVSSPVQITATTFPYPGTTPSISAWGTSNAILWAAANTSPAVLHAYDANNLNTEFYNSNQAASGRDHFGTGNKFIVPTIANGKVYVGTTNSVAIFGFVRKTPPPLADGDYRITNQLSNLLISDPGASDSSGVTLVLWTPSGELNDEWYVSYNGQGYYTIENVASKLLLTDPTSSTSPGALLQQQDPLNNDSKLWSLTASGSGFILQNKQTGLAVDDLNGVKLRGAYVGMNDLDAGADEVWTFN